MSLGNRPIAYFNRWLADPIDVVGEPSVRSLVDALNRHPLARDETAQDYFVPPHRYREHPGRFRILGENQDLWYCFVEEGREIEPDPPVYFESSLDLEIDHACPAQDIIDGDHVLVCERFTDFVWHMLGQQIAIRLEGNGLYAPGVSGVLFDRPVAIRHPFFNPLGREFPAGFTCYIAPETICIPEWGAAFLDEESRRRFLADFSPIVSRSWA
jgi:hypothetical protein